MSAMLESAVEMENMHGYDEFEIAVAEAFKSPETPLFQTDADVDALWNGYLDNIDAGSRQHYTCNCCRHFIQRFGGLVTIDENGRQTSLWRLVKAPRYFRESVDQMAYLAEKAMVVGVFMSSEPVFGTPKSPKGWTHLHSVNPSVYRSIKLTAFQRSAELVEDFKVLDNSTAEFTLEQIETAVNILKSEHFPGYEKGVGIAEWYLNLRQRLTNKNKRLTNNIMWNAVATAPAGYTHLKNGMVGTLLEDIKSGKSFDACKMAWAKKMHPAKYMRPTAPVSSGQIEVAEKLVEKLGLANSLKRRFANLTDLREVLWMPREVEVQQEPSEGGVFGHLRIGAKAPAPKMTMPNQNITWHKFNRDVLPTATKIEIFCPEHGGYTGLVTAEDPDSPPILQWDNENLRNPVSYYQYVNGSSAQHWNLSTGWHLVTAVFNAPHGNTYDHHKKFIGFSIQGAYDTVNNGGLALFPDILKTELREIRAVIEAHSNKGGRIAGRGNANGLVFKDGQTVRLKINDTAVYTLDRWE